MTFVLFSFTLVALIVLLLVLLARVYPGSGADLLDWKPTRSYEDEALLESQDVKEMLAAQNAYRRKRGESEMTEADAYRMAREDESVRERGRATYEKRFEGGEDELDR